MPNRDVKKTTNHGLHTWTLGRFSADFYKSLWIGDEYGEGFGVNNVADCHDLIRVLQEARNHMMRREAMEVKNGD